MSNPPPSSTYRLQIRSTFDLNDAAELVGYLAELGVGAVYLSPILTSATGSDHGYDVVDVTAIDPARGGTAGWQKLVSAAADAGLQVVVDIVPNHLGVAAAQENPAWWDVLQYGQDSTYADWFDINWSRGRLLLPVLGDDVDLASELSVVDGELRYYERRFPLAPGTEPTSSQSASDVHDRQHYELVNYRRADTEQNYRRFFAVTTLAGVRVEDEPVFAATHAEILRWVREDGVHGIRVDHPDGLVDPGGYLDRLREQAPDAWITVEKILEPGESLLPSWPVAGTTGYDAMTEVCSVLIDTGAEQLFTELYQANTGDQRTFHDHVIAGKRVVASTILSAEVQRLATLAPQVPDSVETLTELLVAFPVYRSYLPDGEAYLDEAAEAVRRTRPDLGHSVEALLPVLSEPTQELARRFQQASGAIMAKGVEDTAYYRYNRFIALNEVGGNPAGFGLSVLEFHQAQQQRQQDWPESMTSLSTHDTKRGEDVRARLAVLSELPAEWEVLLSTLQSKVQVPNPAFAYLLWQSFLGAGLISKDRMHAYAEKAMREANDGTGWTDPDEGFEAAVHTAVDTAYDDPAVHSLLSEFIARIEPHGWSNSLSQKLLQLTVPGIPDVYQGTELWEDSLVDPDNRRAVEFATRRALLESMTKPPVVDRSAAAKLWVTTRALRARRDRPELFSTYSPVEATGRQAEHLVGFDRGGAITLATRLPMTLATAGGWADTSIELDGSYTDVLTERRIEGTALLADVLSTYPVALLIKQGDTLQHR